MKNNLINKPMKELIKKMNLHTINVEGDFIISKEQLEAFAKMYHKEQLALYGVVVSLPKFCVGQTVKRKSNYSNDFIDITISHIKQLDGRCNYRSSNGVWYSETELLAY